MNSRYYTLYSFVIFVLVVNCTSQEKPKVTGSDPSAEHSKEDPSEGFVKGANVYKMFCLMCHGEDGTMPQTGDYDLAISNLDLDAIIDVTAEGRGTMMPYKSILNEEELKAVAEFTLQLQKK